MFALKEACAPILNDVWTTDSDPVETFCPRSPQARLESWSENHTQISSTVEIGFFALTLEGSLAVFEDMFVFENQVCKFLF